MTKARLLFFLLIAAFFSSCKTGKDNTDIRIFKDIPLFISQSEYDKKIDSIVKSEKLFSYANSKNSKWTVFQDVTSNGEKYFGYVVPFFEQDMLTGMSIFYSKNFDLNTIESNVFERGDMFFNWLDNNDRLIDINAEFKKNLSAKYGQNCKTSIGRGANKTLYFNRYLTQWDADGLLIELSKDATDESTAFYNFSLRYSLSDSYKEKNKDFIEQHIKSKSKY
jgi:hypothetical protein